MLFIILMIICISIMLYNNNINKESFVSNLSYIDPNCIYLHADISEKEDWWNKTHGRKLYYYHDYEPQYMKE